MQEYAWSNIAHRPLFPALMYSHTRLHVSDKCISREEFARHQRRASERDLSTLISQCWDKYCYAQRLIHPGADWGTPILPPDLSGLRLPWDRICVAYRQYIFDPQIDFFEEQRSREFARWHMFKLRSCVRPILDDPVYTRGTLERAGLLESGARDDVQPCHGGLERILANMEERYGSHESIDN